MLCESVKSDQKEKERDSLSGNNIIKLKNLITNIDNVLCSKSVHRRGIYIYN